MQHIYSSIDHYLLLILFNAGLQRLYDYHLSATCMFCCCVFFSLTFSTLVLYVEAVQSLISYVVFFLVILCIV